MHFTLDMMATVFGVYLKRESTSYGYKMLIGSHICPSYALYYGKHEVNSDYEDCKVATVLVIQAGRVRGYGKKLANIACTLTARSRPFVRQG